MLYARSPDLSSDTGREPALWSNPATRPGRRFDVQVDNVGADDWHALMTEFDDAVVHQSWAYGKAVRSREQLSHLVLREREATVAAAQVVLSGATFTGIGVAHVKFGPLWQRRGASPNPAVRAAMLDALHREYSSKRGLVLRIKPWLAPDAGELPACFMSAGFRYRADLPHYTTYILDLGHELDDLHKALKPKWRYHLRRAARQVIEFETLAGTAGMDTFLGLYRQMSQRKGFFDSSEIAALPDICRALPDALQPRFLFCRYRGHYVAGMVVSHLGKTAFYWFGATACAALEHRLSYALHWYAVQELKQAGCRWYDLAGISQPGVQRFKSGLAGRLGHRVAMADYDHCRNPVSRATVDVATAVRTAYRATRIRLNRA